MFDRLNEISNEVLAVSSDQFPRYGTIQLRIRRVKPEIGIREGCLNVFPHLATTEFHEISVVKQRFAAGDSTLPPAIHRVSVSAITPSLRASSFSEK